MVLFQNSILRLDYNPATDILEVEYPNLHVFLLPEIKHTFSIMIDIIRNYDIKKLLLDSYKTTIPASAEDSKEIAMFLASELIRTRIQKVARIQSGSSDVEASAQENLKHINTAVALPYQVKNFTSKSAATDWLLDKDQE